MSVEVIALIALGAFLLLLMLEVPVAFALAMGGSLGIVLMDGVSGVENALSAIPYASSAKYVLFVIPMYLLLGALISNVGIGTQIYRLVNHVVGRLPGGLAASAVAATALFSGISGSSAADVATFGRISVNEMARNGYDRTYAAGVVAAAGTFAVLIPPNLALVIYGVLAEVSIGALIMAALVPGVLSALFLMAFVVLQAIVRRRRADASVLVSAGGAPSDSVTVRQAEGDAVVTALGTLSSNEHEATAPEIFPRKFIWGDLLALLYTAILFGVVVGGLYGGFLTATEAAAIAALLALIIAFIARRGASMRLREVYARSLRETVEATSMIFLLIIGGSVFTYFLAISGIPIDLVDWAVSLPIPPLAVVGLILLALLPLGTVLDSLSILLLTVPLAAPLVTDLGFDGVWFGILVIKMVEIGLITPPVGLNVFIISGVTGVRAEKTFVAVAPFVVLDLAATALFFSFPDLVLWLPRAAGLM